MNGADILTALAPWSWFLLALVLLGLEILVGGVFLIWFAAGALITGLADAAFALVWQVELFVFGISSIAAIGIGRWLARRFARHAPDACAALNQRGAQLMGQRARLVEPIYDGTGRIAINDTMWRVTGPELDAGTEIEIHAIEGNTLHVRRPGGAQRPAKPPAGPDSSTANTPARAVQAERKTEIS